MQEIPGNSQKFLGFSYVFAFWFKHSFLPKEIANMCVIYDTNITQC